MLFAYWIIVSLLCKTVLANVCSLVYTGHSEINVTSKMFKHPGYYECQYLLHAPRGQQIILNFTQLLGFQSTTTGSPVDGDAKSNKLTVPRESDSDDGIDKSQQHCLPEVIVSEIKSRKRRILRIINCKMMKGGIQEPFVINSSYPINITYRWLLGHVSGFKVYVDLSSRHNHICKFTCADSSCLYSDALKCDGHFDCIDQSDEDDCLDKSSDLRHMPMRESIQVTVICVAIVFTVLFIVCIVVRQYCSHSVRERHSSQTSERACLQPNNQHSTSNAPCTEVVYLPVTFTEQLSSQMSSIAGRDSHVRPNYPPNIPVSLDGEEGYKYHQLHLQNATRNCNTADSVCIPPNTTVFDVDGAPPPYYPHTAPPYASAMIRGFDLWPYGLSSSFGNAYTNNRTASNGRAHKNDRISIFGHNCRNDKKSVGCKSNQASSPGASQCQTDCGNATAAPHRYARPRHNCSILSNHNLTPNSLDRPPDYRNVTSNQTLSEL